MGYGRAEKQMHHTLGTLKKIVEGLGKTLGRNCEIVLHDISNPDSSIIAIANGHVTGRNIGSPATDFLLDLAAAPNENDMVINYFTKASNGKQLKSSTFLVRDEKGEVIGAFCINIDISQLLGVKDFVDDLLCIDETENNAMENFPNNTTEFLQMMIDKSLSIVNKPVEFQTKEDKLKIVAYLNKCRVFKIKGAVDFVAKTLKVSRYTIYNYLDEITADETT